MLLVVHSMAELRFSELMQVYTESNLDNGREKYPHDSENMQLCNAEQDFYHYLNSLFFRQANSCYAIWEAEGRYQSALRLEPYSDGFLLCGLETAPEAREKGYASALIRAVQEVLSQQGSGVIYSHVSKKNMASLNVHLKCGFEVLLDHAVYSDGSVLKNCSPLAYKYKKSGS